MLASERHEQIVAWVCREGNLLIRDLKQRLGVSSMTIWRDLRELEQSGHIYRVRGGIRKGPAVLSGEPEFELKRQVRRKQKLAIARYAAGNLVHNDEVIILEAGTTVAEIVNFLEQDHLTVITNGLAILNESAVRLSKLTVMSCGGILRAVSNTFVGPQAVRFFKNIRANTFFLSATGMSFPEGITDPHPLEVEVKRAMSECADRVVVLLDSSKFGMHSLERIIPVGKIDLLVTDREVRPSTLAELKKNSVSVEVV